MAFPGPGMQMIRGRMNPIGRVRKTMLGDASELFLIEAAKPYK
jgi:hypothetical protein